VFLKAGIFSDSGFFSSIRRQSEAVISPAQVKMSSTSKTSHKPDTRQPSG
jgi:hypothetical protein